MYGMMPSARAHSSIVAYDTSVSRSADDDVRTNKLPLVAERNQAKSAPMTIADAGRGMLDAGRGNLNCEIGYNDNCGAHTHTRTHARVQTHTDARTHTHKHTRLPIELVHDVQCLGMASARSVTFHAWAWPRRPIIEHAMQIVPNRNQNRN